VWSKADDRAGISFAQACRTENWPAPSPVVVEVVVIDTFTCYRVSTWPGSPILKVDLLKHPASNVVIQSEVYVGDGYFSVPWPVPSRDELLAMAQAVSSLQFGRLVDAGFFTGGAH
jgi:hypothetical protein